MNLTHLKKLESESIHIFREVAAEFDNPVMLYSVGKDSGYILLAKLLLQVKSLFHYCTLIRIGNLKK